MNRKNKATEQYKWLMFNVMTNSFVNNFRKEKYSFIEKMN
jgi:hypothetical protein